MARYVCPSCRTDEKLFSVERAEVLYPVTVGQGREVEYKFESAHVLYETAQFADVLFCRGCDQEYSLQNLKKVRTR